MLEHANETGGAQSNSKTRDIWGPTWALVGSVSLPLCQEIERATQPPSSASSLDKTSEQSVSQPDIGTLKDIGPTNKPSGDLTVEEKSFIQKDVMDGAGTLASAPILELDIKLGGGSSASLSVRPGDVPEDIAKVFAEKHGLSAEKQLKLTKVIQASLAVPQ